MKPDPSTAASPHRAAVGFQLLVFSLFGAAVLIEILVMVLLDNNFWFEKKELNAVYAQPLEKLPRSFRPVPTEVYGEIASPGSIPQDELEEHIRYAYEAVFEQLEDPDFPAVRLEISDPDGGVIFSWEPSNADEKRRRFNTWENSLFSRNFEYKVRSSRIQLLTITFVNSPEVVQAKQLTWEYRLYALLFTLSNAIVIFLLYRGAIRPFGRIASALGVGTGELPPIIPHPRHATERAYNTLVRGTRLTQAQSGVSDLWESLGEGQLGRLDDAEHFWGKALEMIRVDMGYRWVAWIPADEKHNVTFTTTHREKGFDPPDPRGLMKRMEEMAQAGTTASVENLLFIRGNTGLLTQQAESNQDMPLFVGPVSRREEITGFLVAVPSRSDDSVQLEVPYFRDLSRQLGFLLTRALERQEEIDRGRFEVSIDLSASMGHDLTNILATGRLELETLRTAHKRGIIQVDERKAKPISEALEGLRKTTVLLQEVVNVYRAFSYTRRPHLENIELNQLGAEVIELYRHSTSRKVDFVLLEGDREVPAFADPRLVKLVLFNLLANATQAITQRQVERPEPEGRVEVDCRLEEGWSVLRVTDNGTGFRSPKGQRLEGVELNEIFQFDFTTKSREGGLGLAWVRSIVEDVHDGRLVPSNRGEGLGAVMEVFLPPQSDEAKSIAGVVQ